MARHASLVLVAVSLVVAAAGVVGALAVRPGLAGRARSIAGGAGAGSVGLRVDHGQ